MFINGGRRLAVSELHVNSNKNLNWSPASRACKQEESGGGAIAPSGTLGVGNEFSVHVGCKAPYVHSPTQCQRRGQSKVRPARTERLADRELEQIPLEPCERRLCVRTGAQ